MLRTRRLFLAAALVVAGSLVVVADGDLLRSYRLMDGQPGPVHRGRARWSAAPVRVGDKLLAGTRDGVVEVLDAQSLELRYLIRGVGAGGPVAVCGDRVVIGFDGRMVLGFAPLP